MLIIFERTIYNNYFNLIQNHNNLKLFSDLAKFLDTSAKSFFPYINLYVLFSHLYTVKSILSNLT